MTGRGTGDADDLHAASLRRLDAVARESERQQTEIDQLRQDVHLLLSEVDRAFGTLTSRLDEVAGATDDRGGARGTPRAGPDRRVPDARLSWPAVAAWLEWLHTRYPLADDLPACWWRHRAAADVVFALYDAWNAADEGASGTARIQWHTRWLPAALTALRTWMPVSCFHGAHSDDPATRYGRAVDDPEAFDSQTRPAPPTGPL
ncbi:hypothetical protein [Streptomyces sp. NPDC046985]|uniref:hypothetical protein n=1 Tax=Streptomyces sp. NPDC046985 TaxID=3155377 RepID=UPI003403E43A